MPAEATISQISELHVKSWKSMLKAIALYRDGSKLSQPLNSSNLKDLDEVVSLGDENTIDETKGPQQVQEIIADRIHYKLSRNKLPKKRDGHIREAVVGGHKLFLRTGEYEDGTLGEIFIDMYKEGASFRGLMNSFAILASKALQYGVPLEDLVDTFTFTRFEPSGPVEGHEAIKNATSVLDYVFRSIGYDYLNRKDFVHVKAVDEYNDNLNKNAVNGGIKQSAPKEDSANNTSEKNDNVKNLSQPEAELVFDEAPLSVTSKTVNANGNSILMKVGTSSEAQSFGYTGEHCTNCGSMRVKRNGSCTVCEDCGSTSGCS